MWVGDESTWSLKYTADDLKLLLESTPNSAEF